MMLDGNWLPIVKVFALSMYADENCVPGRINCFKCGTSFCVERRQTRWRNHRYDSAVPLHPLISDPLFQFMLSTASSWAGQCHRRRDRKGEKRGGAGRIHRLHVAFMHVLAAHIDLYSQLSQCRRAGVAAAPTVLDSSSRGGDFVL